MKSDFIGAAFFNESNLFDFNISYGLKFFQNDSLNLFKEERSAWKEHTYADLHFNKTTQQFFNLEDDGKVFSLNDIQCLFVFNQSSLLILLQDEPRLYHLQSSEDVFTFISNFNSCWLIADGNALLKPDAIKYIDHFAKICFEVTFISGLKLKFLNLTIPAPILSMQAGRSG